MIKLDSDKPKLGQAIDKLIEFFIIINSLIAANASLIIIKLN